MSMTRDELIAALEASTGPSRELDFWCWWWGKAVHDGQPPDADYAAANITRADAPRYTASIDAALTLVPEELWRSILHAPNVGKATVSLRTGGLTDPNTKEWMGYAYTPAIAICIAALKARGA